MIEESRIRPLNRRHIAKGEYVLYWMQASQRVEYNHALEFAIKQANELKLPLIVFFGLTDAFPEANERHYYFMLEGLRIVRRDLRDRGTGMIVERVSPEIGAGEGPGRQNPDWKEGHWQSWKQLHLHYTFGISPSLITLQDFSRP